MLQKYKKKGNKQLGRLFSMERYGAVSDKKNEKGLIFDYKDKTFQSSCYFRSNALFTFST